MDEGAIQAPEMSLSQSAKYNRCTTTRPQHVVSSYYVVYFPYQNPQGVGSAKHAPRSEPSSAQR